jgi:hypothetical protein
MHSTSFCEIYRKCEKVLQLSVDHLEIKQLFLISWVSVPLDKSCELISWPSAWNLSVEIVTPNNVICGGFDGVWQVVSWRVCALSVVEHSIPQNDPFLFLGGKVGRYLSPLDKVHELRNIKRRLVGQVLMLLPFHCTDLPELHLYTQTFFCNFF